MLMGKHLLDGMGIDLGNLDHRNFKEAKPRVERKGEWCFHRAIEAVRDAIVKLYGSQQLTLQRLSATFRRGDLIQELGL